MVWLDTVPPGLWFDEARNIDQFAALLRGEYRLEFFDQEPLYVVFLALGFAAKGLTVDGLRLSSAIAGILTIPLVYYCVLPMFGRRTARWTTFVLAVLPWHIIYSRIGFRAVTAPLMQVICIGLLFRALHTGTIRHYVLLAAALIAGMFSYLPFLVTPVVLAGYAWLRLRESANAATRAHHVQRLLMCAAVVAGTFFPATHILHKTAGGAIAHSRVTEEGNYLPGQWLTSNGPPANLLRTAGMFIWRGDANPRHNAPGNAQIPRALYPFLLVGILCELRARRSRSWLVLGWFATGLLPTIFSADCPHATRALCAAIPACVLISRGGMAVYDWMWRRVRTLNSRRVLNCTPWFVAACLASWNAYQYFTIYGNSYAVWESFQSASVEAAHKVAGLPRNSVILQDPFENGSYSFEVLTRLAGLDVRPLRSPADLVALAPVPPQPFYYIIVGRDRFGSEFLQKYPGSVRRQLFTDPTGRPIGALFRVR
ncbi:MAG: hypothetical protein ACR2IE_13685 [Candidatus Sumerlaeaceae bacterium]